MTTNSATPSETATTVPQRKPNGIAPWIILALWFAWLAALVAMSFPEWGKSKRDLLDAKDRVVPQPGKMKG